MKAVLVFFFALLPVIAVASGKRVATATGPRGGTDKVKFDVKTDRSQHPLAKPEPGKTPVYFLQDDSHFLSVPSPPRHLASTAAGLTLPNPMLISIFRSIRESTMCSMAVFRRLHQGADIGGSPFHS